MHSPLSLPRSSGPVRHDGWPNSLPPLADHTTAYLAQQMRRADEVAEATKVRRLAEAGLDSSAGGPVMARIQRTVRIGLGRVHDGLRGTRLGSVETRSGMPTVRRPIRRGALAAETRVG
jgi:hypothetical protein